MSPAFFTQSASVLVSILVTVLLTAPDLSVAKHVGITRHYKFDVSFHSHFLYTSHSG